MILFLLGSILGALALLWLQSRRNRKRRYHILNVRR